MGIWIPLIYPFLIGLAALFYFRHKVVWWESLIPIGVGLLFIAVFRFFVITALTNDTEYWSGTVHKVEYYEDWNEYIHRICYRTVSCGKNCTRTVPYDCSYVQYHSSYCEITDNNGLSNRISKSEYKRLSRQFNQTPKFVDLHRSYHTNDGDKYKFHWQGERETCELMVTEHSYENKVQVAKSVYSYPEVSEQEVKQYKLFNYPEIKNHKMPSILGKGGGNRKMGNAEFNWLNATLGKPKQLRIWVLLFNDQIPIAGQMQERYWKGGNKNEFVICIGLTADQVKWCHTFSWSDSQEPKITIRNYVMNHRELDLLELAQFTGPELEKKFKRKQFKDFAYLTVEPPFWAIIWCHVLVFLITVGITFWNVLNDFDNENFNSHYRSKTTEQFLCKISAWREKMQLRFNNLKWW